MSVRAVTPRTALRQARLNAGLTLEQAAKAVGYSSKSAWAMVEAGLNTPPVERMKLMARVVGKRPSEVFPELQEEDDHDDREQTG